MTDIDKCIFNFEVVHVSLPQTNPTHTTGKNIYSIPHEWMSVKDVGSCYQTY